VTVRYIYCRVVSIHYILLRKPYIYLAIRICRSCWYDIHFEFRSI